MTLEVWIEDSFDFEKEYVRCTASRWVQIASDVEVTPQVLGAALANANIFLPEGFQFDNVEFAPGEEKKARDHYYLIEKIGIIASAVLSATPQIFQNMSSRSLEFVKVFPKMPHYAYWSNGTITSLSHVKVGESNEKYTPMWLMVDRDSNGVSVTAVFDLNPETVASPFKTGDVVNRVEIKTSANSFRMKFEGDYYIAYPD